MLAGRFDQADQLGYPVCRNAGFDPGVNIAELQALCQCFLDAFVSDAYDTGGCLTMKSTASSTLSVMWM